MPAVKWTSGLILLALAVIFALGLTYYASIELPARLHRALDRTVPALEGDSHNDEDSERAAQDEDWEVRLYAVEALKRIRTPDY